MTGVGVYKKLVINDDGTRLLGAILVGDAADYGTLLQMMLNAMPLPARPESLLFPAGEPGAASAGIGVAALPANAQICSCNNVSKGRSAPPSSWRGHPRWHEEGQQGRQLLRRLRVAGARRS